MEKTIHSTVTELGSSTSSEKCSNDIIKETGVDKPRPAAAPTPGIRRTKTVYRERKQKPLPLDRLFQSFHRTPRGVRVLLIIVLSGIPFVVFMLVARFASALRHHNIGPASLHATYFKLSKWLMICWASLIIIFGLAETLARLASWACSLHTHWVKYAPLANTMCFRVTMLVWAAVAYEANCIIWPVTLKDGQDDWPNKLKEVFQFLAVSFAIILVQGVVLQLIAIRYVEGYVGPRAKRASNELQTIHDINNLVKHHIEHDDPSYFVKIFKSLFYPVEVNVYDIIASGNANEEEHREYAANIWNTITTDLHKEVLTPADFAARLKDMGRDPEAAEDLFGLLDQSCDGQVSKDELETLVVNTGAQLNKRANSMRGIKNLLFKLEILLTLVMFGIIVFIYSKYLPPFIPLGGAQLTIFSQLLQANLGC